MKRKIGLTICAIGLIGWTYTCVTNLHPEALAVTREAVPMLAVWFVVIVCGGILGLNRR